jgi:hypothetical protein
VLDDETCNWPPAWQWPGPWALNLPILAVLWQGLFARAFHVNLEGYHLFATAALVWLFVAVERWLFLFRARPQLLQSALKAADFAEQRASLIRICGLVLLALGILVFFRATPRETGGMLMLLSAGGAYLAALSPRSAQKDDFFPREMALPAYITGAITLFIWTNAAFPPMRVLLPGLLFLLLLFYYFCLITRWAKSFVPLQQNASLLETPLAGLYRTMPLTMIFAGAALSLIAGALAAESLMLALAVSGATLLLLEIWQTNLSPHQARMFADAALLTPLVPFLLLF